MDEMYAMEAGQLLFRFFFCKKNSKDIFSLFFLYFCKLKLCIYTKIFSKWNSRENITFRN